ncbi:DUF421 domain-containing protein [Sphingobacterium pedocola]|uniref:DUF421 domain-containing protein n=1 Tax=Sphingobacterium pedocola TaxID=2082722 RepID=A0ABR9T6C7_9SPHI|nr:YetF domain-containing protein [Sphingobacterium pedocola]MBE8720901.1 DUF421 domain-containing protein [Sphingobacterium pedocola]
MEDLFFSDGKHLTKVIIATIISYFALMFIIRLMGKRTLAKMNAFDFVVTVTLGSTLSSMLLNKVPVVDGAVAVLLIISLQYLIAYLAQRSEKIEKVVNHSPTLLYYNGKFMEEAMKRERITEGEILAEIRSYRLEQVSDVRAVVMEINGTFSVIKKESGFPPTTLDEFKEQ